MTSRHLTGALFLAALLVPATGLAASAPSKAAPKAAATTAKAPTAKMVLPFIDDDYSKALNEARQKKIPIFIDNWAPW
jgi:hypothetical protein